MHKELEKQFAKFIGTKYAVSCNSGTSALHLSLVALGIGKGDEVIVPDFTMAACGFAVAYTGAKVVTVDCGDDYNIDPKLIEAKITKRTKAIMPVHIYGRLCDMKAIRKIAKKYKLKIIEDGAECPLPNMGGNSDCLCFSFYKNKIIHAEEGGIVCTNSKNIYNKLQYLKNMSFDKGHSYFHKDIGFNYRMPDSQAKMVLKSLGEYKKNVKKRYNIAHPNGFTGISGIFMYEEYHDVDWVIDRLCVSTKQRNELLKLTPTSRYFFKPLSKMPMFKQKVGKKALDFSNRGLYYQICINKCLK